MWQVGQETFYIKFPVGMKRIGFKPNRKPFSHRFLSSFRMASTAALVWGSLAISFSTLSQA